MSTFGGLGIAATGLSAARAALEVTGQNVANANTPGYTRQRVDQTALASTTLATYSTQSGYGDGVTVTGVSRVNDSIVDARVNSTAGSAAYWSTTSTAVGSVEDSLNEPTTSGLASQMSTFFNDWQTVANNVGTTSASGAATALIQQGQLVASTISSGYTAATQGWSAAQSAAASTVTTINDTASSIADLNTSIRSLTASGGNVNSLLDQRDAAVTTLAGLTGATTRSNADGTIDVVLGGNTLVSGDTARKVALGGATDFSQVSTNPVKLTWADNGAGVSLDGGQMAAQIAALQPADATGSGTGGVYAEAAKAYNDVATALAAQVNALHSTGTTPSGAAGGKFFDFTSTTGAPAANLVVVPTSASGIAAADGTKGTNDNTIADKIAQLSSGAGTPGASWSTYVARIGSQSATATSRATTSATAATAATTAQTSVSGVDLDEETSNLVIYQHAYQASARVISTINDVLNTLINMGVS
jgi:flagellar hook-associated protein 1 FlgK